MSTEPVGIDALPHAGEHSGPRLFGRRLPPVSVAGLAVALLVVNGWTLLVAFTGTQHGADWLILERAAGLAGQPELYAYKGSATFVWSPIVPYALQLVVPLGLDLWRVVSVGLVLALPTWPMRLFVVVSGPFWLDVVNGNVTTIVFVAAVWALRGSTLGTVGFFLLALLVPRPLVLPVLVWILWWRPQWRLPFVLLLAANGALVLASGLTYDWISAVAATGREVQDNIRNMSPARWIGSWWIIIAVPLSGWLTWKGRLGWAGLALSPYIWPFYLLFVLLDLNRSAWITTFPLAARTRAKAV